MLSLIAALSLSGLNPSVLRTSDRMQWWRDARFGMFIHWDMSSLAGTEISWSRKGSKPLDIYGEPAGVVEDPVYDHLYERFNPTRFCADEWAILAKRAGMRYVVLTAKHHGGFAMFHTKLSDYGIEHTEFKRDVVDELASACRRHGLRFGIYYSQRDWHHPDYGVGDNAKYHDYLMGQLRELLTLHGKIDVMWFDSFGKGDSIRYWKADEMLALVHQLQPDIIVNNRSGYFGESVPSLRGDFDTPEQRLGEFQNKRNWESCMTVVTVPDGGGWSFRSDGKVRPLSECIRSLVSCACGDGNLLLDVGPDSTGVIPNDQSERLLQIGRWLRKHSESIYRTSGGPYRSGAWGGSTFRGNTVYIHMFGVGGRALVLPPVNAKVVDVRIQRGEKLTWSQDEKGVVCQAPNDRIDPIDCVVEIKLNRPVADVMPGGEPLGAPAWQQ